MNFTAQFKGIQDVLANFKKKDDEKQAAIERGMKRGALIIFRQSQLFVPVDKGNLKGSGFVRVVGRGINTRPQIGYTANYAIFVHENLAAHHGENFNRFHADEIAAGTEKSRGPNQIAKFLENAAIVKRWDFVQAVKGEAQKS